jgi:hypothetical protein
LFVTHDVDEAIYLADRVAVPAPNAGRIDAIFDVPLPPPLVRNQDLKLSPDFLALKKEILPPSARPPACEPIWRRYSGSPVPAAEAPFWCECPALGRYGWAACPARPALALSSCLWLRLARSVLLLLRAMPTEGADHQRAMKKETP